MINFIAFSFLMGVMFASMPIFIPSSQTFVYVVASFSCIALFLLTIQISVNKLQSCHGFFSAINYSTFDISRQYRKIIYLGYVFIIGFSWMFYQYDQATSWKLPKSLWGKSILLEGRVSHLPQNHGGLQVFSFKVSTCLSGAKVNSLFFSNHPRWKIKLLPHLKSQCYQWNQGEHAVTLRLSWYRKPWEAQPIVVGDVWQLLVRVKPPKGLANPGQSLLSYTALSHRIKAVGYVRFGRIKSKKSLEERHMGLIYWLLQKRQAYRDQIYKQGKGYPFLGVMAGITLGYRDKISSDVYRVFQALGISHLLAISGLHVSLIAYFFICIARLLSFLCPRFMCYYPFPYVKAWLGGVVAVVYSLMSGFSVPTQRACAMLLGIALLPKASKVVSSWSSISFALMVVLIYDPFSVLLKSFWLSFGAVVALLFGRRLLLPSWLFKCFQLEVESNHGFWGDRKPLLTRGIFSKARQLIYRMIQILLEGLKLQWVLFLVGIPFNDLFFHQWSWVSIPINLLVVPIFSFLLLPLSFLSIIGLLMGQLWGKILFIHINRALSCVYPGLEYIANSKWAVWHASQLPFFYYFLAFLGVFLYLFPLIYKYFRCYHSFVLSFILPLLCMPANTPAFGEFWVLLLDVGQGLSLIIETSHHTLVYDTGLSSRFGLDSGRRVIIPVLYAIGRHHIDTLMISHGDHDHSGGAVSLFKTFTMDRVLTSVPKRFAFLGAKPCKQGQSWVWDGVVFEVMHPGGSTKLKGNNASCVLKVGKGYVSLLLMGDAEAKAERSLLVRHGSRLASSVLLVGHHGSQSSSISAFVRRVRPQIALISSGFLNRFHFPHPSVVKRYQKAGVSLLNTAELGAIRLIFSPNKPVSVNWERKSRGVMSLIDG